MLCPQLPSPCPPPALVCRMVSKSLSQPTLMPWPPPSPLSLPHLGSFFYLHISRFLFSIHSPQFRTLPSTSPPPSQYLCHPFRNASSRVVLIASAVVPCLHHSRLFLPPLFIRFTVYIPPGVLVGTPTVIPLPEGGLFTWLHISSLPPILIPRTTGSSPRRHIFLHGISFENTKLYINFLIQVYFIFIFK